MPKTGRRFMCGDAKFCGSNRLAPERRVTAICGHSDEDDSGVWFRSEPGLSLSIAQSFAGEAEPTLSHPGLR